MAYNRISSARFWNDLRKCLKVSFLCFCFFMSLVHSSSAMDSSTYWSKSSNSTDSLFSVSKFYSWANFSVKLNLSAAPLQSPLSLFWRTLIVPWRDAHHNYAFWSLTSYYFATAHALFSTNTLLWSQISASERGSSSPIRDLVSKWILWSRLTILVPKLSWGFYSWTGGHWTVRLTWSSS